VIIFLWVYTYSANYSSKTNFSLYLGWRSEAIQTCCTFRFSHY